MRALAKRTRERDDFETELEELTAKHRALQKQLDEARGELAANEAQRAALELALAERTEDGIGTGAISAPRRSSSRRRATSSPRPRPAPAPSTAS